MGAKSGIGKIFMHGRSQAVRLPKEFRLPGNEVRVRRVGNAVLLEPMVPNFEAVFEAMDRYGDVPFMQDGRNQPPMPEPEALFP